MITLKDFIGRKVKATVFNLDCVDDMEEIRQRVIEKYGNDITEDEHYFITKVKKIKKPWLHRERVGVFGVNGPHFFIQHIEGSADEHFKLPRRSFFPLNYLKVVDENTLLLTLDENTLPLTLDEVKEFKIEYKVIE